MHLMVNQNSSDEDIPFYNNHATSLDKVEDYNSSQDGSIVLGGIVNKEHVHDHGPLSECTCKEKLYKVKKELRVRHL